MSLNHNHNHSHAAPNEFNNKFKFGIILNLAFVFVEFLFGIMNDSLALIADAGHNLTDVIGLAIAWGASYLALKAPTSKFTYGFKKSSIIAAQLNSLLLLVAIGIIIWEAINRLSNTPEVEGGVLIWVAGIGVIINGITTYLFFNGKDNDLNIKGAYLHMLADTLISVGVVISGILIIYTSANWIDPVLSIVISIVIFWSTWKLLNDSTKLSLDGVPESINADDVKKYLLDIDETCDIHDLHIWAISTTEIALTVHLIINENSSNDKLLEKVSRDLDHKFSISHTTIQLEVEKCENGC